MRQKLIEILENGTDHKIDEIYNKVFDKRIHMLNYIKAYMFNKINDIDGIVKIHKMFCMLEVIYLDDEQF